MVLAGITHARGVDLFICECTFFDGEDPSHMTYQQIRDKLPHLESKKIVLTHMGREMLAHRNDIPLETAKDGMVV